MEGNHAIIIGADDWEGLFVNGKLVEEGHTLNEGYSRRKYLLSICMKYNLKMDEILEGYVTDDYDEVLADQGGFDENIEDVGFYLDEV